MKILKLFTFFFLCAQVSAQDCLPFYTTFDTQDQIDSFAINYPDCRKIGNTLVIEGPEITNLQGLSNIEEIEGHLMLLDLSSLTSLAGLDNLKRVGDRLEIERLPLLTDLDALSQLQYVGYNLSLDKLESLRNLNGFSQLDTVGFECVIDDCPRLKNLEGLNSLRYVGDRFVLISLDSLLTIEDISQLDYIGGTLQISANDQLINLDGLEQIESVGGLLIIQGNQRLRDIKALSNVNSVGNSIAITRNDSLINLDGLEKLSEVKRMLTISSNLSLVEINALSNIKEVGLSCSISGNPLLDDLEGLSSLEKVGGSLEFKNNVLIKDFQGLSNLTEIEGDFRISFMDLITDMSGFDRLVKIGENLYIRENDNLISLEGLNSLDSIGDFTHITKHQRLKSLNGLESLRQIGGSMSITENDSLTDIRAIRSIVNIENDLSIAVNPLLSFCAIQSVCNHLRTGKFTYIGSNGPSCNDTTEVLEFCERFGLAGTVYFDYNQNQQRDSFEGSIPLAKIIVAPNNDQTFTDQQGQYLYIAEENQTYQIELDLQPEWQLTTDSTQYTIFFEQGNPDNFNKDFGLYPTFSNHNYTLGLNSNPTRCDTEVQFYLNLRNEGSFLETASQLILEYPPTVDFIDALISPTSIDLNNRRLTWEIDSLYPWTDIASTLTFQMPGVTQLGDSLLFTAIAFREEVGVMTEVARQEYRPLILCAYDPNDKLVSPPGILDEHYTLKEETFNYTIRFQNTGNAPAIDVLLVDSLDVELDWSTFQFQEASHLVQTTLSDDGVLRFYFPDINLPDSTASYTESQGFVRFQIDPLPGLADSTRIENRAYIYFDSNPPIITNTTLNTLVDELPKPVNTAAPELSHPFFILYPNPADEQINWQINQLDQKENYQMELIDLLGRPVTIKTLAETDHFDLETIAAGSYWILLRHQQTGQVIQVEALQIR